MYAIFCQGCANKFDDNLKSLSCPDCGAPLDFQYDKPARLGEIVIQSMWRYRALLPVMQEAAIVSMGEGATPLERSRHFKSQEVYIKNEARNPTGSHKDRALSVGITKALEFGKQQVMLYSDGSTALASAAYAARAGLQSFVLVPSGTPKYRLLPLILFNSQVLEYQGRADAGLRWVHEACGLLDIYETTTSRASNPYEFEGTKTMGYEIFEQLERVPEWIVVPIGGGATIAAIWRAFKDLLAWGFSSKLPRMVGVLPENCSMLQRARERGITSDEELRALAPTELPPTIQAKISMAYPPDGLEALMAINESKGAILYSSDDEVLGAQKHLAAADGIYAEPSAAASVVGVEKLIAGEDVDSGDTIIAIVTGSGFRETATISDCVEVAPIPIHPRTGIDTMKRLLIK